LNPVGSKSFSLDNKGIGLKRKKQRSADVKRV
jgi:hypothetical protein